MAMRNVIFSNLFLRSIMISIIFFYDKTKDRNFINNSILCTSVLSNTTNIVTQLLDEIKDEPLTPNNKSTVITCLMTAYMLKHLGMQKEYDDFILTLRSSEEYRY